MDPKHWMLEFECEVCGKTECLSGDGEQREKPKGWSQSARMVLRIDGAVWCERECINLCADCWVLMKADDVCLAMTNAAYEAAIGLLEKKATE